MIRDDYQNAFMKFFTGWQLRFRQYLVALHKFGNPSNLYSELLAMQVYCALLFDMKIKSNVKRKKVQ